MAWEVKKRVRYALCCTDCGSAFHGSGWYPYPQEAEKKRAIADRYPCKTCENRTKVAALPLHHPHHQHNPDWPYPSGTSAHCCAAVQIGAIGLYDCNECGEPWPCSATVGP